MEDDHRQEHLVRLERLRVLRGQQFSGRILADAAVKIVGAEEGTPAKPGKK